MTVTGLGWINLGWLLLDLAIVAVLIPTVLLQRRESGATLSWIMVILLVPFLGLLAFWLFGTTRLHLRRRKRRRVESRLAPEMQRLQNSSGNIPPEELPVSLRQLAKKLDVVGLQTGNDVLLLRQGPALFDALEAAIDEARAHIHLVYYIWEPDRTGIRVRDALTRAAARGVQVRLLLDDVGSRRARGGFFSGLVQVGGQVDRFAPRQDRDYRWLPFDPGLRQYGSAQFPAQLRGQRFSVRRIGRQPDGSGFSRFVREGE